MRVDCEHTEKLREWTHEYARQEDREHPIREDVLKAVKRMTEMVEHVDSMGAKFAPEHEQEYVEFLEYAVARINDERMFHSNKASLKLREFVTSTDEALAMLLLLNSYKRWIDMYLHPAKYPDKKGKKNKDEQSKIKDEVKCIYTADGFGSKAKKMGGWSEEGHIKMGELRDAI
jgi:hypothetical protein